MASTALRLTRTNKYDVFLSFRSEDTRHSFTDHLYKALVQAGISVFRDNNEIDRGQELKPEIEKAIAESRAYIIVLSENYAKSKWCLNELVLILEQRRNFNGFVLPVFYQVDPLDVRNQQQSFAIEAKDGVECSIWTKDNVSTWKASLTEVADLTGLVLFSGSEVDFISKVVDTIDCKLDLKLVSTPAHLTGIETRGESITSWLNDEQPSDNFIAICGMGGSGKTTLAQHVFNSNKHKFECSSFLQDIGRDHRQPNDLLGLQKQLLTDIIRGKNIRISNVCEGTNKIEEALQTKKVLIILDDIVEDDELAALLGKKGVHTQSKIIITTRRLDIYAWFGSISRRCWVHKLELLNDYESLKLLSFHAFGSKIPMEGFEDLAVQLAKYCEGNPLALKVLGSSLFVSADDPINSMIEIWSSRMNSLKSLKGDLDSKIQCVLQKSFESLPYPSDKELFLHIACLFIGAKKDSVATLLEDDYQAKSGIMTLINRCLLTITPTGTLAMHQLIRDMGRKIVCDESKDVSKRSRVCHDDESYRVLRKGDGSETIEGLTLNKQNVYKQGVRSKPLSLKTPSHVKMKNLKILLLYNVKLSGSYKKNFPDLRCLGWYGSPQKTIPTGLFVSSLVAFVMTFGELEKFEPPTVLISLKILNLAHCSKLVSIRNLHRLPKLETLNVCTCTSLTYLCKTIGNLENLSKLNLTGCNKLWKASLNKKYVNQREKLKAICIGGGILDEQLLFLPRSLKFLYLGFCKVERNNDIPVVLHAQTFFYLSLEGNLFEFLPNKIDLNMLRTLKLNNCANLKSLICLPSTLEELYTDWCTSLEKITFQYARFKLQKFVYEGCFKLSEIQGLFKLVPIAKLDEAYLGQMKWIKAYEDRKVDLVGDVITKGRIWRLQMLYEYGIRSTFLPGIKDQSMTTSEYTSSSPCLSFHVPICPKKCKFQGLNVTILYRSSCEDKDQDMRGLFVQISNITKGITWMYNPVVYSKPKIDEDVVWLSYWPIGNTLDAGDEVGVSSLPGVGMRVISGCGASLVYVDDGEVKQEENLEDNANGEEVIGGDLSEFEVKKDWYYLCRRDFFMSKTSYQLKKLFDDTVHYPESQGWRKSRHSTLFYEAYQHSQDTLKDSYRKLRYVLGVSFNSESEIDKIEKAVYSLEGVESIEIHEEVGRLLVIGHVDPVKVETRVREFEKIVQVLYIEHA